MNRTALLLAALTLFMSCGSSVNGNYDLAAEKSAYPQEAAENITLNKSAGSTENPAATPAQNRKVIKTGNISFETDRLGETRQYIDSVVKRYNGYLSSEEEFKSDTRSSHSVVVRLPAPDFDNFIRDLDKHVTRYDHKNINANDVTAEFIDISARVKTKKELEARYLELLKKATTTKDMLEIERAIGDLRSEIESIEGRLRYLGDQTDYSTATITYYKLIAKDHAFGNKFGNGFVNGWNNLIWFFIGLVNIWPFVLGLGVLLFWLYRRLRRKRTGQV